MKTLQREVTNDSDNVKISIETNVEEPFATSNDVKIEVKACGVSFPSTTIIKSLFHKNPRPFYPVGNEVAGTIVAVGSSVTSFKHGDSVVGLLSLDSTFSGCSEFCVLHEYDIVKIPDTLSFQQCAASIGDGIKAFTALHYLGRICSGDTVLIMDGATSFGSMAIQLAMCWGAKVLTTASSSEEKSYLLSHHPNIAQVIEFNEKNNMVLGRVIEETGGIGVDCIIDSGVKLFTNEEDGSLVDSLRHPLPSKHELILSLAVGGRWVTSQSDLQLDPPNSELLYMKCASVCFLFEHVWTLATAQQGRFQHIMRDVLAKVSKGLIKPNIQKIVKFEDAVEILPTVDYMGIGKVVVVI